MFPSKVIIASTDSSLNHTLVNFLQKSGWVDIQIARSFDHLLEFCCLTDQEILIFLYPPAPSSWQLLESLQSLRRKSKALLILILDPNQIENQSHNALGKLIDGFLLQPVNEYYLNATLMMARERRQRELDLLKSEEKFQRLFLKSNDPSLLVLNQIIIDCNQAALNQLRAERREILGKSLADLSPEIQPDGNFSVNQADFYTNKALKTGFIEFRWLHRRFDGSQFLAEVSLTAIPYAGDLALFAKWRDVTEIEQYKKSLQMSEQRYRQLFETMLNGFALHEMIFDEHHKPVDYRFIAVNPAFEKLTGLSADAILGKTVLEVLPNTEPYWIETYGKVAWSGEPVLIENYSQELDRYYRVFAFSPVKGQFATLFEDITIQRKNERYQSALLQLSEKIRQAYTTEEMAQTIVHTIGLILELETAAIALKSPENADKFRFVFGTGKAKEWIGAEFTKDQGITGYTLRSKTPYFQNNLANDPYYLRDQPQYYHPFVAAVPLISGEDPIGVLLLGRNKSFTDTDQLIVTSMSELIGNALQRMLLQEKTQQTVDYLSALRKIDLTITLGRDLGDRLSVLLEVVVEHQKVDAASIWLKEPQTDFFNLAAIRGFRSGTLPLPTSPYPGITGSPNQFLHLQNQELQSALDGEFGQIIRKEGFTDYMGIPLTTKKK